ncbi:putative sulfate exporter family transporter [Streptomyces sp. NBC_01613]|uniref:YeiH family protein n=1 Tax=Streptomyces sp. NBC_01613 TaxID=2975896 RepID=UPI00386AE9A6
MEPSPVVAVKPPTPPTPRLPRRAGRYRRSLTVVLPGLAFASLLAVPAMLLGRLEPTVGGPVFGILAGALTGPLLRRTLPNGRAEQLRPGCKAAGRHVLQASIVVLGTGLPLREVLRVGTGSLPVMFGTLAVALGGAWLIGRLLRIHPESRLLIGVGTGICGASAIAAVTAAVGAAEARVAYAMGTIFTFNIAAVLLFPLLGHLLGMSQHAFGLWSGTAVNDTSSVVATAYGYGAAAGKYAVVVKLTRSLMIVPICVALRIRQSRRQRTAGPVPTAGQAWRVFPVFILGFLAASALATSGAVPPSWDPTLSATGLYLITTALTGIGLTLDWSHLREAGVRPLVLGAVLWSAVSAASLGLQFLSGRL